MVSFLNPFLFTWATIFKVSSLKRDKFALLQSIQDLQQFK